MGTRTMRIRRTNAEQDFPSQSKISLRRARFPFGVLIGIIVPRRLKAFHLIAQGNALGVSMYLALRPVRAKSHVCCYALTGRKIVERFITQGVALGYKIKALQA